eukprot:evm.model.scf_542.5 EVM.evm.TU.scf_542.5   scf_542:52557-55439(+)
MLGVLPDTRRQHDARECERHGEVLRTTAERLPSHCRTKGTDGDEHLRKIQRPLETLGSLWGTRVGAESNAGGGLDMAPQHLWLLVLACAAVAANGLAVEERMGTADPTSASRRLLACGGRKPDCCKTWDWSWCKCTEYKDGWYYDAGECVYSRDHDYECPDCCDDCDYLWKKCNRYKHGWAYEHGSCYYRDDYKCPDCCEECDYDGKYCKKYKYGYSYEYGECIYGADDDDGDDDDDDDDDSDDDDGKSYECPHCCEDCDYDGWSCKSYKHGWAYEDDSCYYKDEYECPNCCEECDYEGKYCKKYKHGWGYDKGSCYYREDYKCPDCCEECDYDGKYCKKYKHGWSYDKGSCYYKDDYQCPECCDWCDFGERKCGSYKAGWEYVHGECRRKDWGPSHGSPTAKASASAECFGKYQDCSTHTETKTSTTPYSSKSSSYSSLKIVGR